MKPGFYTRENWILPKEGTLGNKAKNLLDNTPIIETNEFKIPKSMSIPYEYIRLFGERWDGFMFNQIDAYFPNWRGLVVRSNSPDEDLVKRTPGMYVSEHIWHKDRGYASVLIARVLDSYDNLAAKSHRFEQGLPRKGMCLLIQEPVGSIGVCDAGYSGCFTDLGELGILSFTNHEKWLKAMIEQPLKQYRVSIDGVIEGKHSDKDAGLAKKLRQLTRNLPKMEGKGWEIEFAGDTTGDYVLQTSSIYKHEHVVDAEDNTHQSIFATIEDGVVGTDEILSEGILYAPSELLFNLEIRKSVIRFNEKNKNYCVAFPHMLINSTDPAINVLYNISHASIIFDLAHGMMQDNPFAPHVMQHMREGRVALAGVFIDDELSKILTPRVQMDDSIRAIYSPTKLKVRANEYKRKAQVTMDGKVEPFVSI